MRSNAYCGNLLWQSSLTLQAPGFHEIPKNKVMHKLYTGCINCAKHADPFTCPEIAMVRASKTRR